jgi:hypothetical protein
MLETLLKEIKFNCDMSDARFWGYFSICGLLMRYRDLYRSEQGLEPWSPIGREEISAWIEKKEAGWTGLEGRDFQALSIGKERCDAFDVDRINHALEGEGYAYGAGYGVYLKPTFFLARAKNVSEVAGHKVYTTEQEIVRDLFTAPAMLQGRSIFLRLDPLKAILWDKFAEYKPGRPTVTSHAFEAYGLRSCRAVDDACKDALGRMVVDYAGVLLHHELAESREAVPQWKDILTRAGDRKAEHYLRAVQDLVADTSDSGPLKFIVDGKDGGALSLAIGLMEGYRRLLFPEIRETYQKRPGNVNWREVDEVRKKGFNRFQGIRRTVLALFNSGGPETFSRGLREMMQKVA